MELDRPDIAVRDQHHSQFAAELLPQFIRLHSAPFSWPVTKLYQRFGFFLKPATYIPTPLWAVKGKIAADRMDNPPRKIGMIFMSACPSRSRIANVPPF